MKIEVDFKEIYMELHCQETHDSLRLNLIEHIENSYIYGYHTQLASYISYDFRSYFN